MIYFTGDTHGEVTRFRDFLNYGEANWTADDTLIICGDFGYLFKNDVREHLFLNELAKRPYTICFCDGNHENFPAIYEYPVKEWNGGKVHEIRPNILHLMRGQIFTIEDKKIFAMGGAYSRDKAMRRAGYSWWPEELPTNEEYKEAAANLKAHDFKVDYIVSHTAPTELIRKVGWTPDIHDAELTGFLEWVMHETEYQKWFFGPLHIDEEIYGKHRALSFDVIAV